jgi:hypothetical protein
LSTLQRPNDQIKSFIDRPSLSGRAFVNAPTVTTNVVSILYEQLDKSGLTQTLSGQGQLNQSVQTIKSSEGGGLNLGPIAVGGSKTSNTVQNSISRYVSRNFALGALESGSASTIIHQYSDGHPESGTFDQVKNLLLQFILGQMKSATLEFSSKDGKLYDLTEAGVQNAEGLQMTIQQIAIATKGDDKFTHDTADSISIGKINASDKNDLGITNNSDIQWNTNGNILVPSSVDVYVYNQDEFKQNIQGYYSRDDVQYTTAQSLVESPGSQQDIASASYMPTGVGMIITSMIPWEKQTSEFQQYWLPADGREVTHGAKYFTLITGLTADNSQAVGKHVFVPDLRGVFLRGLNQFAADMPASAISQ